MQIKNPLGSIYGVIGAIVALTILILVIYFIGKQIGKNKEGKEEVNAAKDDVKDLIKSGIKPTMNASALTGAANGISSSLSKAGWTKSDAFAEVYRNILKIGNEVDLLNLKSTYGIREIYNGIGNLKSSPKLTLTESIYLLSPKEVALINEALAKKGIKNRI